MKRIDIKVGDEMVVKMSSSNRPLTFAFVQHTWGLRMEAGKEGREEGEGKNYSRH